VDSGTASSSRLRPSTRSGTGHRKVALLSIPFLPWKCRSEGNRVIVDGEELLNADCTDFLGLMEKEEIREACRSCIEKYGVGSCGPRAFYGTTEPHLFLEAHLAKFLGTQESIVYSYDIATVASVLPAFANQKDVIVVDEHVYFAIQSGCQLSRAQVHRFKHNDLKDLERLLVDINRTHKIQKKPLNRRFIVVEGIYHNGGDLAKLDGIFELKKKYKYRLVVDESLSLGVLGKTGKGACEEFGLGPGDVEIVTASMSNALASIGGFCAGDHDVIGHQRLNGNGYIFSASLPPYLAVAADQALSHMEQHPESFSTLRARSAFMREILSGIPGIRVIGSEDSSNLASPIIHLELSSPREDARGELARICKAARVQSKVIVSLSEFSGLEWDVQSPSLRLTVTLKHSKDDLVKVKEAIEKAVLSICNLA